MSHASIELIYEGTEDVWKGRNRLSLAGTSDIALSMYLETRPFIKELVFCLDADDAGREASGALARKYSDAGYSARIEPPLGKDYNEELIRMRKACRLERSRKRYTNEGPCR